jgi:hypothetical protein
VGTIIDTFKLIYLQTGREWKAYVFIEVSARFEARNPCPGKVNHKTRKISNLLALYRLKKDSQ